MLHCYISQFLEYCRLVDFSIRSIQALTARMNEFKAYLKLQKIRSVKKITYPHLIDFVADFNNPSIHVRKSRVWTLRQFFHFLTLHRHVPKNIALKLPYPKIEKTVPQFLTINEYNRLIRHFSERIDSHMGLRNLIIIMLLGTLGLRTSTLIDCSMNSHATWPIPKHRSKSVIPSSWPILKPRLFQTTGYSALSKIRQKRPGLPHM